MHAQMGLGKTLQSIALICASPQQPRKDQEMQAQPVNTSMQDTQPAESGRRARKQSAKAEEAAANAAEEEEAAEGSGGAPMEYVVAKKDKRVKKASLTSAADLTVGQIVLAKCKMVRRYNDSGGELAWIAGITALPTHTECQVVFRSGLKASGLYVVVFMACISANRSIVHSSAWAYLRPDGR